MDNDPQTTSGRQEQPDQERQNRRQFFNGLGKWSLAIIAAVTALRDGLNDGEDDLGTRFGEPSTAAGDPRKQIARHGNISHGNLKAGHTNLHFNHANHGNGPFRDPGWTNTPA
jgi:hypothetical protein